MLSPIVSLRAWSQNAPRLFVRSAAVLLAISLAGLLLTGCGEGKGRQPEVEVGRFEVHVDGLVKDTLRGEARYRLTKEKLSGFELVIDSVRGLSIDVEPGPVRRKTFQVVEWELLNVDRPGGAPGTAVFWETPDLAFESTDGTVQITYTGDNQIGGVIDVEMEGDRTDGPLDTRSIRLTGAWNATPLRVD